MNTRKPTKHDAVHREMSSMRDELIMHSVGRASPGASNMTNRRDPEVWHRCGAVHLAESRIRRHTAAAPANTSSWERIATFPLESRIRLRPGRRSRTARRTANVGSSGSVGIERGKPMETRAGMIAGRATYTVDEVAVLLDLSRGNAYRYVREGVIPAKRVGRRWMVPRKTFHAWLESCEAEAV
jgi:excisionase family DNA binding protein